MKRYVRDYILFAVWLGLVIALSIMAFGCEPTPLPQYRADTPELLAAMEQQGAYLEQVFAVRIGQAYGKLAANDGRRERGRLFWSDELGTWVYSLWYEHSRTMVVSGAWTGGDVRHELMHAAGYEHKDRVVNGVRVADHVVDWRDA